MSQPRTETNQSFDGVAWEERSSWLDLAAFWRTSLAILFQPSAVFSALNYNAGIRSALIYALVYGSLGQIIGRYWFTVAGIYYGILDADALENSLRFVGTVFFTPILLVFYLLCVASLIHLLLWLFGAASRSLLATFQVIAYVSGATSLLSFIPFLGNLLAPIWILVLYCVGLAMAHQTTRTRVLFALLLPLILMGILVAGAVLLAIAVGILDFLGAVRGYI
ncbi:MAG: YIP1 family protein [Deltaproteobacteria bacterium]|nr:MAG: YIP1 family protein [Deltaproteobacteria bacterium]